ncbi:MAG TPA: NADH-quinone oxidoreductase subunit N [Gemmatimonadaceae bacterium]|nr:NADH-quinone oxidoreductase subunit N [Gemmatimonadaceae bacterium]
MNAFSFSTLDLGTLLLPELIVSVGAMLVLLFGVSGTEGPERTRRAHWLAIIVALLAAGAAAMLANQAPPLGAATGPLAYDGFRWASVAVILLGVLGTLVMAMEYNEGAALGATEPPALVLLSAAGMLLLVGSRDMMLIFLGIEVMSLSIYVLTGLDRSRAGSAEAALKYFLLGAFSTAFLLYGMALLYGSTGTTNLPLMAAAIGSRDLAGDPLLLGGMALLFIGFSFKVAAAPFHMWTPDVYEGAPTPYTAFMAVGVKVAAFAAFARILLDGLGPAYGSWHYAAWMLAAATMLVGNVLALVQQNVKRMLAYSSIAHAGYLLVAITSHSTEGVAAIVFYALAYTLATVGAFAVLSVVSGGIEKRTTLADLAGLSRTRPALATAMAIFMLSLLGFPVAGGMGFFAKWYVLRAAIAAPAPQVKLAVILVLASVVSAAYYLGVITTMFMKPVVDEVQPRRVTGARLTGGVIAIAALLLLVLGIYPTPAVRWARASTLPMSHARAAEGQAAMQALAPIDSVSALP